MDKLTDDEIKTRIASKVKKLYAKQQKKYTCEFCGTGFDKRDFLISHMKIRHPDEYDLKYGESNYASLAPNILNQLKGEAQQNSSTLTGTSSSPISAQSTPSSSPINASRSAENAPNLQMAPPPSPTLNLPKRSQPTVSFPDNMDNSNSSFPSNVQYNENPETNMPFMSQTTYHVSMDDLDAKLDSLNTSLGKTIKVMDDNMKNLNKELRYLICEYKSPFILFDL